MEALNPREDESHGGTAEVPEGDSRASDPARVGRSEGPASRPGAVRRIGEQLGINPETLRGWVTQAEIDDGSRPGTTTSDAQRMVELEREDRVLRRSNAILRSSSALFAAELDRPQR
jgi:transposase